MRRVFRTLAFVLGFTVLMVTVVGCGSWTWPEDVTGSIVGTIAYPLTTEASSMTDEATMTDEAATGKVGMRQGMSWSMVTLKVYEATVQESVSDVDGKFTFSDVVPGEGYNIYARKYTGLQTFALWQEGITVHAGMTTDLGLLPLKQAGDMTGIVYSDIGNVQGAVLEMMGTRLTSDQTGLFEFSDVPYDTYTITASAAGYRNHSSQLTVEAESASYNIYMDRAGIIHLGNVPPAMAFSTPTAGDRRIGSQIMLTWAAYDPDDDAAIALYYDTDSSGSDGTQIASGFLESADSSYLWNASQLTPESYYVYGLIDDGFNEPVAIYSIGTITLTGQNQAPEVALTSPLTGATVEGSVVVGWDASDADGDTLMISLYYSRDSGASWTLMAFDQENDGSWSWDTEQMSNGDAYRLKVEATDGSLVSEAVHDSDFAVRNQGAAVQFANNNLELKVRDALSKPSGDIYADDLAALTVFDASSSTIDDISGIEHLTSLTELDLSGNQITDLTPLQSLTSLEKCDLGSNQVADLQPLSSLTSLTELVLTGNELSDVTYLGGLTSLQTLDLSENDLISSVASLGQLPGLASLDVGGCQVTDLSGLGGSGSLTTLVVDNNQINDITGLAALTGLTSLDVSNNLVSDITALSGMTGLLELNLGNNQVTSLDTIAGLTNLTSLDVSQNLFNDLDPLNSLPSIQTLDVSGNTLTNIDDLALSCLSLQELDLSNNLISDIQPLVDSCIFSAGATIDLQFNQLNDDSLNTHVPALVGQGITVLY